MAKISFNDIVMATATLRGTKVASFTSSGFNSMEELIRAVACSVGASIGMIDLDLRNSTQGWRERRSIYIPKAPAGLQLSLF